MGRLRRWLARKKTKETEPSIGAAAVAPAIGDSENEAPPPPFQSSSTSLSTPKTDIQLSIRENKVLVPELTGPAAVRIRGLESPDTQVLEAATEAQISHCAEITQSAGAKTEVPINQQHRTLLQIQPSQSAEQTLSDIRHTLSSSQQVAPPEVLLSCDPISLSAVVPSPPQPLLSQIVSPSFSPVSASEGSSRTQDSLPSPPILKLSDDLLLRIASFVTYPNTVSIKLACKDYYAKIPVPLPSLPGRTGYYKIKAIFPLRYTFKDDLSPPHLCIDCKQYHAFSHFVVFPNPRSEYEFEDYFHFASHKPRICARHAVQSGKWNLGQKIDSDYRLCIDCGTPTKYISQRWKCSWNCRNCGSCKGRAQWGSVCLGCVSTEGSNKMMYGLKWEEWDLKSIRDKQMAQKKMLEQKESQLRHEMELKERQQREERQRREMEQKERNEKKERDRKEREERERREREEREEKERNERIPNEEKIRIEKELRKERKRQKVDAIMARIEKERSERRTCGMCLGLIGSAVGSSERCRCLEDRINASY